MRLCMNLMHSTIGITSTESPSAIAYSVRLTDVKPNILAINGTSITIVTNTRLMIIVPKSALFW